MRKIILTYFVLLFTLSSSAQWWGKGDRIRGNGNVKTEQRKTSDYDGISLGGSFDVVLVKGKEGNITIEAESNLLEYIETSVKKGNLQIKTKRGYNLKTTRKVVVTVPVKNISKISLGGSGNITSETVLKADDMKLNLGGSGNIDVEVDVTNLKNSLAGSGDIKVAGNAEYMKCSIAGSGSIKAYELQANTLKASIAGSGNIRTWVKDEISASIAGSGSIYYKGNPDKVKTSTAGSGRVRKKSE